jgi:alpha-tubulin suppressor-like RCC1 family protein
MAFNGTGSNVTALNASNISSGTVATGRLATSGTANNTTFLRGDQIWSALPAGGGLTNNVRQAVTSSATTTLDVNSGNVVDLTMAANITTLAFSNVPASGTPLQLVLVFRNAADATNYQVTWPASIYWNGSTAQTSLVGPTLTSGANSVTVIALLTTDGGTKWRGWVEASIPGQLAGNALYAWGSNSFGTLGLNNTTNRSSPVQVGSLQTWTKISVGASRSAAGILNTGELYAWGGNANGQLGLGNITDYSSPKQVGALKTWVEVAQADAIAGAIKADGTLWTWGKNNSGQLGLGDNTNRSSPTQVGALTNWSLLTTSYRNFTAIKTDGTLWTWGYNGVGQLGVGTSGAGTQRSSPVQVGALTNWAKLNRTQDSYDVAAAIKTDGTLWTWGRATDGVLGHGNTTNYSSPKQVGALTNWSLISVDTTCAGAIKTDGTLWTWGGNASGQLGLGNKTSYSSPKQLGAATDWSKISIGDNAMLAVKTGGTLWSWGRGTSGQLGQNIPGGLVTSYRSSPGQVGALTTWTDTALGISAFGFIGSPAINPA